MVDMDEMPVIDVLLVADSQTDGVIVRAALSESPGFRLAHVRTLSEALTIVSERTMSVVLLDFELPGSSGLNALGSLRDKDRQVAIVVLAGNDDSELALQTLKDGAQDYLVKGELQPASLRRAIRLAVGRGRSENMLRQSEERLQELSAHVPQVFWMTDAKISKLLYVSVSYEELWGRSRQSLINNPQSYLENVHPLDQEMMIRESDTLSNTGYIDVECRLLRSDGSVRWVWVRGYPVMEQGQIVRLVGITEDVTEKRRLAAEREALLSRLQLHIERMPLAYLLFDADFRLIDWNPTAERIFGYSKAEMLGQRPPFEKLVPASFWDLGEEVRNRIRSGDMHSHSTNENLTKDGRTITCEWFNTPLLDNDGHFTGLLCLAKDVTDRMLLEAQLQQSQKMESIGHLAGGVAHDFNNLLTVIICSCDALQSNESLNGAGASAVREIDEAAGRAALLTRQLLAFSRKQLLEPVVLNPNEVVSHIHTMLLRLITEDIDLSCSLFPAIWPVRLDPGQIEQVIVNLVVNARDAMPKGGRLTIETSNVEWTEKDCRLFPDRKPGRYVMIGVSDTGSGISPEIKSRMFDPFFTTMEAGKRTGLGLAVVHGIVKQSEGYIDVDSGPGAGTAMKLYFPAVGERLSPVPDKDRPPEKRGSETVLLVEDEEGVRGLLRSGLEKQGYTVIDASNGQKAIETVEDFDGPLHLVITDVVMPVMGGRQLVDRLLVRYPDLKVLYITGYTDDAMLRHGIKHDNHAFLQKPFSPSDLTQKVRLVLDADGRQAGSA
jgi:PAS domain S-box-containing protein